MHVYLDLRTTALLPAPLRSWQEAVAEWFLPVLEAEAKVTLLVEAGSAVAKQVEGQAHTCRVGCHNARSWRGAKELMRWVKADAPDIYWSADPLICPPAGRVRRVYTVAELSHFTDAHRFSWSERLRWRVKAQRRLLASDALLCPSHALEVRLVALLGLKARRKTHVVREGVLPIFSKRSPEEILTARRQWRVPQRYVLMVAREGYERELAVPLKAVARSEEVSSVPCVIVGNRETPSILRGTIRAGHLEGLVRFIDSASIDASAISALYSGADVTFEPSLQPDASPAVLQSMACGAPVICAATATNRELFGQAVLRVHPTDADEWSKAFVALTLSQPLRERQIERGLALASQRQGQESVKATLQLFKALLENQE